MKKGLLIAGGIVLILAVLAVWVYLMFFGVPEEADDIFANFSFGDATDPVVIPEPIPELEPESTTVVDVASDSPLQQLTTKSVAGYVYIATTTSSTSVTQLVQYAERGTGHIYEINLDSGEEVRVSGTTIPKITDAVFSPNGTYVALSSFYGFSADTYAGVLSNENGGSVVGESLPPQAREIHLTDTGSLSYIVPTNTGSRIETKNLNTNIVATGQTLPFTSISMIWDTDEAGTDYFYNSPDSNYTGSLYKLSTDGFTAVVNEKFGLAPMVQNQQIIETYNDGGGLVSSASNLSAPEQVSLDVIAIPEKCVFSQSSDQFMFCASDFTQNPNKEYLTNWYKGVDSHNDLLWRVSLVETDAILLLNPEQSVGRTIDVYKPFVDFTNTYLFFINKRDGTLWLYDQTI